MTSAATQNPGSGRLAEPLWLTDKMVERPCCVAWVAMGSALLLTGIIIGGSIGGAFKFALDTSPNSFKLTHDTIADRGEAVIALRTGTTAVSMPRKVREAEEFRQWATSVDTAAWSGKWWEEIGGIYVIYEAMGASGSIFSKESLEFIAEFEAAIRALESFRLACERKPGSYYLPAGDVTRDHCEPFRQTPLSIGYARMQTLPIPGGACCTCREDEAGRSTEASPTGGGCIPNPVCEATSSGLRVANFSARSSTPSLMGSEGLRGLVEAAVTGCTASPQMGAAASAFAWFFDKATSPARPTTRFSRGYFPMGYVSSTKMDEDEDAIDAAEGDALRWLTCGLSTSCDDVKSTIKEFNARPNAPCRISAINNALVSWEVLNGILASAMWALLSGVFVTLYMAFHMRSLLLATAGQAHILISFPVCWFFYRCIFQLKYMGMLNFISMFVILGIGADDCFVFADAWRQSRLEGPAVSGSVRTRLAWAYRRSAKAMLITTLTDAAAFYSNCISSITVVRIFGAFCGTLVLVNFVLVVTWFPSIVVWWHNMGLEDKCCPYSRPGAGAAGTADAEHVDKEGAHAEEGHTNGGLPKRQPRWIERMCTDVFAPALFRRVVTRVLVVAAFVAWTGAFVGLASQLEPTDKDFRAESFPEDTNLMLFLDADKNFNGSGQIQSTAVFVVGVGADSTAAINRDNVDLDDPTQQAPVRFPEQDFDPTSAASQLHLVQVCDAFEVNGYAVPLAVPGASQEGGVSCFIKHFKNWVNALGMPFPVPSHLFIPLLENFTGQPSNQTCNSPRYDGSVVECRAYHRTALAFPSAFRDGQPELAYNKLIRWDCGTLEKDGSCPEDRGATLTQASAAALSSDSRKLRALTISINVSMSTMLSGSKCRPYFDSLEDTATQLNAAAPHPWMQGFQDISSSGASAWMRMRTEEVLSHAAYMGCVISVVFAFVMIALGTANLILAFYSLIAIGGIVVSCVGFMFMIGWKFGTMEAICITICVGFSVDFVVHLAVAYAEASGTRYERTRQALADMGISVTGAAVTTGGAAFFMIFAPMTPFHKLGIFILWDITMALLFAVFMFAGMLALGGPTGQAGNIGHIICAPFCPWTRLSKRAKVHDAEKPSRDPEREAG